MRYLILPLILFLLSCGNEKQQPKQDSVPLQEQVKITPGSLQTITANTDASVVMKVYLPKSYNDSSFYPAVFFFDPHANSGFAIEQYIRIADELQMIFIGSENIRNGMKGEQSLHYANAMISDALSRFRIDEKQITLCGFSGGARVAAGVAASRPDITGVISCSASPGGPLGQRSLIQIAGINDMNYLEMKKYRDKTSEKKSSSAMMVFNGKHEWPPFAYMKTALMLLRSKSDQVENEKTAQALVSLTDTVQQFSCYWAAQMNKDLEGFVADDELKKTCSGKFASVAASACYKNDEAQIKKNEASENDLQQVLQDAMLSRDTAWWRVNASAYFETKNDGQERFMRNRLRGYVSLMCYTYAGQAFSMNNLHAAEKFVKVYSIVDPENSEWAYMQASLYMRLNMKDYAFSSMENAIELGFSNRQRIESDPVFAPVLNDPAFTGIIGKIK